jgi:phosphotransferase system HPr (HPr) family protein
MSESKATRTVVITNPEGLHMRVASAIAETVRRGKSQVTLSKGEQRVEATSVWQILTIGAAQGERIEVEAVGPDAAAVLDLLEPFFAGRFGDEKQEPV